MASRDIGRLVLLAVIAAWVDVPMLSGQSADRSARPSFEASSIKPNRSGDFRVTIQPLPGGRFTAVNAPLRVLVRYAYRLQDFQLEGAPPWLSAERVDITATGDMNASLEQVRLMVRTLLEDRLTLKARLVSRELPSYALVMARSDRRNGPRLRRTEADCANVPGPEPGPVRFSGEWSSCGYIGPLPGVSFLSPGASMAFRGLTMEALARFLVPMFNRSVVDRTGLQGYFDGEFDFTTEFGPPPPPPGVPDPLDRPSWPSIFTVLPEQLGVKLEAGRAPVDVLVIDSVGRPTED